MSLLSLPPELVTKELCEQLDPQTLNNLMQTNKKLFNLCSDILSKREAEH